MVGTTTGRRMVRGALMMAFAGLSVPVLADDGFANGDHNGAAELARGDYARAERVLAASLRVAPNATDLLLNQAHLLLARGDGEAARALYTRVLAQPDDAMQLTGDRTVSAHAMARAGLRRTAETRLAGR